MRNIDGSDMELPRRRPFALALLPDGNLLVKEPAQ
jgi:hypothetical protein